MSFVYDTLYTYRILSVNNVDMEMLFGAPFDFENELSCCFVQLVGMGNSYNDDYPFKNWDIDDSSSSVEFICGVTCCVLEMFCQIVKEHKHSAKTLTTAELCSKDDL